MIANIIICYVNYIYTLAIFANLDFLNDFIKIGVIIVIVILLLSRIIYIANSIPCIFADWIRGCCAKLDFRDDYIEYTFHSIYKYRCEIFTIERLQG